MIQIKPAVASGETPLSCAINAARAFSPYLTRILARRSDLEAALVARGPQAIVAEAIIAATRAAAAPNFTDGMHALRVAKLDVHAALGLWDLTGAPSLEQVTRALSDFADAALSSSLALAERALQDAGDLRGPARGFCVFGMGKLGARELNYSSDVDLIVLFAPNWLSVGPRLEPRQAAVKLTQGLVRAMHEITEDGYVFRTDLRLRPDPGSTPVAVSFAAAERYYQSVGENWERAAFIKARSAAGDHEMAEAFLASLRPFLWRRHLDYAAIDDIRAVQRQIHRFHGSAPIEEPAFDVKLGRGGIRDIELFVQTQQLILGGRTPALRTPGTCEALTVLAEIGVLSREDSARFIAAYRAWRAIEHRIQMREDEHTHTLPSDVKLRAHVAALCGYANAAAFDADVVALRREVIDLCARCADAAASPPPAHVRAQTGDAAQVIEAVGFRDPSVVRAQIEAWRSGGVRALRSPRARALLEAIVPAVLAACAREEGKDEAFAAFAAFLEKLGSGVQLLALLAARHDVLVALVGLLAIAPRLSADLAQRQTLLDAMAEHRFFTPVSGEASGARVRAMQAVVAEEASFEGAINAARRYHREEAFRITVQVLRRIVSPRAAGLAFADLAEGCVSAIAGASLAEVERQFGKEPGRHCILALGKFAGAELSAHSDLDVMVIYDAPEGALSSGARALTAGEFYARFTQRLIAGLSAPTEEGLLYEIDMQLRPSGSKGPVAVRLSSLDRYYREDAWTWELQALTRARVVMGEPSLSREVEAVARKVFEDRRDPQKTRTDVASMRARMDRERKPYGPFDLKLSRGGMVDIEFIAQALILAEAGARVAPPISNTVQALAELAKAGVLARADEQALRAAFDFYTDLQHVLRASAKEPWAPEEAAPGLQALLCAVGDAPNIAALREKLEAYQADTRTLFERLVGPVSLPV